MGLDNHLLNESGSDLGLDNLADLVGLHNLLSVRSQVLDGLSVDRVLGVLVLQLLEGGIVKGNQCRSRVRMLVDTGQTDRSFVSLVAGDIGAVIVGVVPSLSCCAMTRFVLSLKNINTHFPLASERGRSGHSSGLPWRRFAGAVCIAFFGVVF